MRKFFFLLGVALLFASCQTEMQVVDPIEPFGLEESAKSLGAIIAATPAKTDMYFKSSANIYVYDTQTLELVYKKTVFINEQKEFLGYFSKGCLYFGESSEAGKQKVYEYWANVLANKALEEYNNVKKSPLFAEVQDNAEEQSEEKQE